MMFNRSHHAKLLLVAALALCLCAGCSKKEAEEKPETNHEADVVTLTKENLEHVSIKVEPVALGNLEKTLNAAGRVTENQNKTAKITSTLEGRLLKFNVDVNDAVKSGEVIALVQTPELLGKPLEIKAPIDGVILERKTAPGELVTRDKEICTVGDPKDLWVIAEVKERDIGAVKANQEASFTVLAYPGEVFHGKVERIANQVEAQSRTLEVRIEVNNADGRLKPGMFADIEITTTVYRDVIVIPDTALQTDEDRQIVFVAMNGNKFQKRAVKLGMEERGRVQALDGLKVGDRIVTEGSFILKSELLKAELGEE
jgi:multidrug efflux pump subunit AcrA (membrane-fusion protein)